MVFERPNLITESPIMKCSWCNHIINENGIRLKEKIENKSQIGISNGICLVCAVTYFK